MKHITLVDLPQEILLEIFTRVPYIKDGYLSHLELMLTCRRFRDIIRQYEALISDKINHQQFPEARLVFAGWKKPSLSSVYASWRVSTMASRIRRRVRRKNTADDALPQFLAGLYLLETFHQVMQFSELADNTEEVIRIFDGPAMVLMGFAIVQICNEMIKSEPTQAVMDVGSVKLASILWLTVVGEGLSSVLALLGIEKPLLECGMCGHSEGPSGWPRHPSRLRVDYANAHALLSTHGRYPYQQIHLLKQIMIFICEILWDGRKAAFSEVALDQRILVDTFQKRRKMLFIRHPLLEQLDDAKYDEPRTEALHQVTQSLNVNELETVVYSELCSDTPIWHDSLGNPYDIFRKTAHEVDSENTNWLLANPYTPTRTSRRSPPILEDKWLVSDLWKIMM